MQATRSNVALILVTVLLALAGIDACTSTDLELETRRDSAPEENPSSESTPEAGGSSGSSAGGAASNLEDAVWLGYPTRLEPPCFARDDCTSCPEGRDCESCDTSLECSVEFPVCSKMSSHCQECTEDNHCLVQFGESFPVCDSGECVQCESDSDCDDRDDCRDGWCGRCSSDSDCSAHEDCRSGHCVPDGP